MAILVRKMTQDDLDRVYEIEISAHVAPWTKGILRDCMRVGYDCFVIEKRRRIQGFAIARTYMHECHLLNICIAPRMQGKGLGNHLLVYLLDWAAPLCSSILLEVRPSNEPARKMYAKYKFKEIAIRKNYYQNPDGSKEEAIVLSRAL